MKTLAERLRELASKRCNWTPEEEQALADAIALAEQDAEMRDGHR